MKNNKIKKYCENCKCEVIAETVVSKETFKVLNDKIEIETRKLICPKCKESIFYEEYDEETLNNAYDEYRKKHNLLSPGEIKEIRKQYGLSQNEFSTLLGWGEKTICRYEGGAIQDNVHNDLLKFLKDYGNMKAFLIMHENDISEKTKNKIYMHIFEDVKETNYIVDQEYSYEPSIYSGFKKFDYDKLCAMVDYFVERIDNLPITKLNKLLNYADNLYFKENCISISGLRYQHLPFGPVPEQYKFLFGQMTKDSTIKENYITTYKYDTCVICKGDKQIDDVLTENEKRVLNKVYKKFKDYGAKQISDVSHSETGYLNTINNEYISYEYAESLSI